MAGGTVTGGVESSVDFNETFSFYLPLICLPFLVAFVAALSLLFVTFSLKYFLFFPFEFLYLFEEPISNEK